jgi:hypothetical protein
MENFYMLVQDWVKKPKHYSPDLKDKIEITVFGPYGIFTSRLLKIVKSLRLYGYQNTDIVKNRPFPSDKQDQDVYVLDKSLHYVRTSNVNLFVYYENAHNDSSGHEMQHLVDKCDHKIGCSLVFLSDRDKKTPALTRGTIMKHRILCSRYDGSMNPEYVDNYIINVAKAKCDSFLKQKAREISLQIINK